MGTSLQSSVIGCAVVAAFAGLSNVGVPGVVVEPEVTVTVADLVVLPEKAVMVATVLTETADVVTVKVAWVWPAGTVTMGGT